MPARNTRFRALTDEFRLMVDRRDVWPKSAAILAALKNRGGGRKAEIARMRAGGTVPEKYIQALVALLRANPVFGEFLVPQGIDDTSRVEAERLVTRIAGPVQPHADSVSPEGDWHRKGIDGLSRLFKDFVWQDLTPPETRCESESDVRTAVTMILATVGRHVEGVMSLAAEESIKVAERHMRMSREEYLGLTIDRWQAVPWTLTFAVTNRQRVGCSLVLPLREGVYDAVRRGERDTHSCTSAELCLPSQTLFLEAVGHKADAEFPDVAVKTLHTVQAIYVQLAALTLDVATGPNPPLQPLRILSMAGNPANERRLKETGVRPTGTTMAGFGIRLMELDEKEGWFLSPIVSMIQGRLLAGCKAFQPPG